MIDDHHKKGFIGSSMPTIVTIGSTPPPPPPKHKSYKVKDQNLNARKMGVQNRAGFNNGVQMIDDHHKKGGL